MFNAKQAWDIIYISVFLLGGFIFAVGALITARLLAPRSAGHFTYDTYECGVPTIGEAWVRFGFNYYLYALVFLAFDVDVLYLFPVSLSYRISFGGLEVFEVFVFVFILFWAVLFVWAKGALRWERR